VRHDTSRLDKAVDMAGLEVGEPQRANLAILKQAVADEVRGFADKLRAVA